MIPTDQEFAIGHDSGLPVEYVIEATTAPIGGAVDWPLLRSLTDALPGGAVLLEDRERPTLVLSAMASDALDAVARFRWALRVLPRVAFQDLKVWHEAGHDCPRCLEAGPAGEPR